MSTPPKDEVERLVEAPAALLDPRLGLAGISGMGILRQLFSLTVSTVIAKTVTLEKPKKYLCGGMHAEEAYCRLATT